MSNQVTTALSPQQVDANSQVAVCHLNESPVLVGVTAQYEELSMAVEGKRGMERAPSSSASLKRKALIDWDTVQTKGVTQIDSASGLQPLPPLPEIDSYLLRPLHLPKSPLDHFLDSEDSFDPSNAPLERFILQLMHRFPFLASQFSSIGRTLAERGVDVDMLAEWDIRVFGVFGVDELCAGIIMDELRRDYSEELEVRWDSVMQTVFMEGGGAEICRIKSEHEAVFGPIFEDLEALLLSLSDEFGTSFYGEYIDFLGEQGDNRTDPLSTPTAQFQALCRWIGDSGRFTFETLSRFRALGIVELSLASSFQTQRKDDLWISHILSVFSLGNSFIGLTTLDLSHISLVDSEVLQHLATLPLENLKLKATQLQASSIAALLPLSWSLAYLDVSNNLEIDDAAIPHLNLFSHLVHLDISGTSIGTRLKDMILLAKILQPSLVHIVPPASFVTILVRSITSITPNDPAIVTSVEQINSMNQAGIQAQLRLYGLVIRRAGENLAGMKRRLLLCAVEDRLDDFVCLEMIKSDT